MTLVNTWTRRNLSICRSISERICSVIFFWVSDGPAIFTSLRRYKSPDASRKYTRNRISTSCPTAVAMPIDPHRK